MWCLVSSRLSSCRVHVTAIISTIIGSSSIVSSIRAAAAAGRGGGSTQHGCGRGAAGPSRVVTSTLQ